MAFDPGSVATNFASDTTSFFRFVYGTPSRRLVLVAPDAGGANLRLGVAGDTRRKVHGVHRCT